MNNKRLVQFGAIMMFTVMLLLSCKESSSPPPVRMKQAPRDSVSYSHADSVLFAAGYALDYERVLTLVDSFFNVGAISEVNANRWRGVAYNYLGQSRSAEFYYQRVVNAKITNDADKLSYIKSARRLSELLVRRGAYEGALKVALPAWQSLPDSAKENVKDKAILLSTIGTCQLNTNQKKQAMESYEESYNYFKELVNADSTSRTTNDALTSVEDIIRNLLNAEAYEEAVPWVARVDTLKDLLMLGEHDPAELPILDRKNADAFLYKAIERLSSLGQRSKGENQ